MKYLSIFTSFYVSPAFLEALDYPRRYKPKKVTGRHGGWERERERERERETDRQTDRQTETERDRETERERESIYIGPLPSTFDTIHPMGLVLGTYIELSLYF